MPRKRTAIEKSKRDGSTESRPVTFEVRMSESTATCGDVLDALADLLIEIHERTVQANGQELCQKSSKPNN
jgi:hypothetical protein